MYKMYRILLLGISVFYFNCSKSIPKDFVYVEGGTFTMGESGSETEVDESPAHEVTLSSFYLSKYEVNQKEWKRVMGKQYRKYRKNCANCAVNFVSWDEVQTFIKAKSKETGLKYRLPTEAEWEYAASGGNKSKNYLYSGSNKLDSIAWYHNNSKSKVHPVGLKKPNELGLYDMSGNVEEWCSDWYSRVYYQNSPKENPKGIGDEKGRNRIVRGGSYKSFAEYCRVKSRGAILPQKKGRSWLGFRLAIDK